MEKESECCNPLSSAQVFSVEVVVVVGVEVVVEVGDVVVLVKKLMR